MIVKLVKSLDESLKQRLSSLGFDQFMKFSLDGIGDRGLVMFLMDHIELDPLRIVVGDKVLPITPEAVRCVLGLPIGGDDLPLVDKKDKCKLQLELRSLVENILNFKDICAKTSRNYSSIKSSDTPRWVAEFIASGGFLDGKQVAKFSDDTRLKFFFICLFNGFLLTTSQALVSGLDYFYAKDLSSIGKYDWCKAAVDATRRSVESWKVQCAKGVKTPLIQGCPAFVMVSISAFDVLFSLCIIFQYYCMASVYSCSIYNVAFHSSLFLFNIFSFVHAYAVQ